MALLETTVFEFLIMKLVPAIPKAVGSVTMNAFVVQFIIVSERVIGYAVVFAAYGCVKMPVRTREAPARGAVDGMLSLT